MRPGHSPSTSSARPSGSIKQTADYGFGYDPLFIPDEYGAPDGKHPNAEARSYAQLTPDEKDAISHRGRAMERLEEKLPAFLK